MTVLCSISDANKPDTAVFLQALETLNIPPKSTLYVGDAVSDVEMAKAAGM